jgi:FkbM family methyltransferase
MNLLRRIRGKIRFLWKTWNFRPYSIEKTIGGEQFRFQIGDPVGQAWYDCEHVWPELSWVAAHLIQPGDVVVDCGAHHGLATLLFARKVGPDGTVIAIEANPRNATVLRRNLKLNDIENVQVIDAAAADKVGKLKIATHSNSSIIARSSKSRQNVTTVSAVTLDSVILDIVPKFLKIDVEGAELLVLRGARRILANRPNLDVELHCESYGRANETLSEIFDLIAPLSLHWHIQRQLDGKIEPFILERTAFIEVQRFPNVHIFGLRPPP